MTMHHEPLDNLAKAVHAAARTDQHDPTSRTFTAMVAVFDEIDDEGDVIKPGAFLDEIEILKSAAAGDVLLPGVWDHDHKNPDSYFADITDMRELYPGDPTLREFPNLMEKGGLWVAGISDDSPRSMHLHRMLKGGRIRQWSFFALGGMAAPGTHDGKAVREIHKVSGMVEVGPTVRGVQTMTSTMTAKSATQTPAGDDTPTGLAPGPRARYLRQLATYS